MKVPRRAGWTAIVLAAASAAAFASFASPVSGAGSTASLPSCYPNGEYTTFMDTGAFNLMAAGSASSKKGSASWMFDASITGNLGASMPWDKTTGSMAGSFTATFNLPRFHEPATFTADCIQYARLSHPGECSSAAEVAFEGVLHPKPWSTGNDEAWVLLYFEEADCFEGQVPYLSVRIGHPNACVLLPGKEYNYSTSFSSNKVKGSLDANRDGDGSYNRGRIALPKGFTPGKDNCAPFKFPTGGGG